MELEKSTPSLVVSKAKPLKDVSSLPTSNDIGYPLEDDEEEPPLMLTQGEQSKAGDPPNV
jgi:hypothetical protein